MAGKGVNVRNGNDCKWIQSFFGDDESVLKLDYSDSFKTGHILKTIELCTLNGTF